MRVLYFVGTLNAGGIERFVTRISTHAQLNGKFKPIVCCLIAREGRFLTELEEIGVPVYEAPKGWERNVRAFIALCNLLKRINPDIVHSQVNFSLFQQFLAVRLSDCRRFYVTERNCYQLHGLARWRRFMQFHFLRLFKVRYSANGEAVAAHLGQLVGTSATKIPVLPNGVPLIPADPDKRSTYRQMLNWSPSDIGIGYVGRMAPQKRQALLVEVVDGLRRVGLPVKACFLGDGPQMETIRHKIQKLELTSHIYLAGTVTNVEDYLQAFDVVALFSSWEGMPNAILEAMAAGKAVVATPVGAIPELLADGYAGLLVDPANPEHLRESLLQVITDFQLRQELGLRARKWIQKTYSIEAAFDRLLTHYEG